MEQDELERLIEARANSLTFSGNDVHQKNAEGETMLHIAVRMRDKEIITVLLNAGADVNVTDNAGNTPFSSAIDTGSPELVNLLLKHKPDFNLDIVRDKFYICLLSSSTDDENIVKSLVRHGFTVKKTDNTTATMLWAAILLNLEEFAISLVTYQRNFLNWIEIWYKSFLLHMQPFSVSQTEMLKIIVKLIDVFMEGKKIETTGNHNLDLFKILLSEYDIELINVNIMSVGGFDDNEESDIVAITTDVLMSCYNGENSVCDEKGRTGLHYAAKVGNVAVIQALLDMNLDINITDIDGKTPLDYINDGINEISCYDSSNDEDDNNKKYCDSEFHCWFTLLDLKIGAVILLKHVSKLITANYYISLRNLRTVKSLLLMMNKDTEIMQYYLSIYAFIEQCEDEINLMKSKKLVELTYYDFLTKNYNQIASYTKRKEVVEALQTSNNILREFEIYGPILQHRFNISNVRRGLIENAETILFDILQWVQMPLVIVREILSNLSNEELFFLVLNT